MTKTLTKQWREGKLPRGHYYCKLYYNDFEPRIQECVKSRYDSKSCIPMSCGCEGEEVLAPVPSYDEYKRLQEQLSEANEVIENMKLCMDDKYDYDCVAEDVDIYLEKWGVK